MRIIKKIKIVILFFIFSCGKDDEDRSTAIKEDFLGLRKHTMIHSQVERTYLSYIPSSYDLSQKTPLLFNFHGYGMSAEAQLKISQMDSLAEKENIIVVFPQGSLLDGYPHWNAGLKTDINKSNAEDFSFVLEIIDTLTRDLILILKKFMLQVILMVLFLHML